MGGLALLQEARWAGLVVSCGAGMLLVQGPKRLGPLARGLIDAKAEVLRALAEEAGGADKPLQLRAKDAVPSTSTLLALTKPRRMSNWSSGWRSCAMRAGGVGWRMASHL